MLYGTVLTHGSLAAAIQSHSGPQYYAPLEDCDSDIFKYEHVDVSFEVDLTRFEGSTKDGIRYYAYDVKLITI